MGLSLVAARTADIATLDEAKLHMNVTTDQDDEMIARMIRTAVAKLDGPRGLLGRCLAPTQYRLTLSDFGTRIALPLPPVQSVDAVTYIDVNGIPQTLETNAYRPVNLGEEDGAYLCRSPFHPWPWTDGGPDAVQITFTAGYAEPPEPLRSAILMHVAHLYENREASLVGISAQITPMGYEDLVTPYTLWAC